MSRSCCAPSKAALSQAVSAGVSTGLPVCPPTRENASRPVSGGGCFAVSRYRSRTADPIEEAREGNTAGMVLLSGGVFLMGTEDADAWAADGEGPVREVRVKPFHIDACAVTNERFGSFVSATGYVSEAERFGWSYVFMGQLSESDRRRLVPQTVREVPWWYAVEGACWHRPQGPGSEAVADHPAVHVTWNDAVAYCRWAGKRLPTEAEWEYAARGGLVQKRYCWGDELTPGGEHRCNIWQGTFPVRNTAEDGYVWTAPVRSFQPNGYGLYQMAGNVWEWCANGFSSRPAPGCSEGSARQDPPGPGRSTAKSMRGGSFLCHRSYCNRYRVAARTGNTPDSSTANLGFRCVRDV